MGEEFLSQEKIEKNNQIYLVINSDFKNPKALSDDIKKAIELAKEEASKSTSSDFIVSIFETPINSLNKYGNKIAKYEVNNNQLKLTFLEKKYENMREVFNTSACYIAEKKNVRKDR